MSTMLHARVKRAGLGDAGNDISFEQAFANLANAYLADKAPKLLNYLVGFQLVDRSDDNTRAAGVFGFKLGPQWLYAPVFFIDGDLKGHELLYLKNEDLFVPLKENWINYLLNKRPTQLGRGLNRNLRPQGLRGPDLSSFANRRGKYASWLAPVMPALARALTADPFVGLDGPSLDSFLEKAGMAGAACLLQHCEQYPGLLDDLDRYHPADQLAATLARVKQAEQQRHDFLQPLPERPAPLPAFLPAPSNPLTTGELQIIKYAAHLADPLPANLTTEERQQLLRDGVLIKDARQRDDQVSHAFTTESVKTLMAPTETGLYDVLVRPGGFEKCLVVVGPHGPNGAEDFCTVVRLDAGDNGNRSWLNIHSSQLWVGQQYDHKEWQQWFDGLESAELDPTRRHTRDYMIVSPAGGGSLPFRVAQENGPDNFEVAFQDRCPRKPQAYSFGQVNNATADYGREQYDRYRDGERVQLNRPEGSKLRSKLGDLFVPKSCKVLRLRLDAEQERRDDERRDDDPSSGAPMAAGSDPPAIEPGNWFDLQRDLHIKSASLRVLHDGIDVHLNDRRFADGAALVALVREHGFREETARHMLKEAAAAWRLHGRSKTYLVKYADWLRDTQPGAPAFPEPESQEDNVMGSGVPMDPAQQWRLPVEDLRPGGFDHREDFMQPDRGAVQTVQQAAQTGQKEIFDTALIGSLLKSTRDERLIDQQMGPLMKGLDAIGRLLLCYYWHQDKFEDRYGKSESQELGDGLADSFDRVGDLVLFLREQQIEPYPSDEPIDLDGVSDSE